MDPSNNEDDDDDDDDDNKELEAGTFFSLKLLICLPLRQTNETVKLIEDKKIKYVNKETKTGYKNTEILVDIVLLTIITNEIMSLSYSYRIPYIISLVC